jgi:hypothetical protein
MSFANFQHARSLDYTLHEKSVTAAYTVKTGTPTYDGLIDNPINIADPAADFTLTVPDGQYLGQELVVVLTSNASSATVTITTTTGDDNTLDTAGDFAVYQWMGSVSGWQRVHGEVAS